MITWLPSASLNNVTVTFESDRHIARPIRGWPAAGWVMPLLTVNGQAQGCLRYLTKPDESGYLDHQDIELSDVWRRRTPADQQDIELSDVWRRRTPADNQDLQVTDFM